MGTLTFAQSNQRFEADMKTRLGASLVAADLELKHRKMRESPFLFLRATCFRWAEQAATLCPEFRDKQTVGAVIDAHAGNFGLWRDQHMRLVWGVNDFDEAARAPWPFDLVRLATSLILVLDDVAARDISDDLVAGYRAGLAQPAAHVLEREHLWLREAFAASDSERRDYWDKLDAARPAPCNPPSFREPLLAALGPAEAVRITPRSAGAGSLGRSRFAAMGIVDGGPVAAEIKATLPSAWASGQEAGLAERLARGRYRSPDPSHHYTADHVVRRLSPNNGKIDFSKLHASLDAKLLTAMAADLAAIHAGEGGGDAIGRELAAMPTDWLRTAAKRVAVWTQDEWRGFSGQR